MKRGIRGIAILTIALVLSGCSEASPEVKDEIVIENIQEQSDDNMAVQEESSALSEENENIVESKTILNI